MNVILNCERECVIDDRRDVRDVKTSRRYVRGNQQACSASLEILQSFQSRALRHVAVQSSDTEAFASEHALDSVSLFLVQSKDKNSGLFCSSYLLRYQDSEMF